MPRKKKTEVDVTCYDVEAELKARLKEKPVNYGSGMTKLNNELMAKEEKRNE
jgi:hypothetical protein